VSPHEAGLGIAMSFISIHHKNQKFKYENLYFHSHRLKVGDWVLADETINPYQFVKLNDQKLVEVQNNSDFYTSNEILPSTYDVAKEPIEPKQEVLDIPLAPDYDFLDITPETWSDLSLEVKKTDGSITNIRSFIWCLKMGLWS
jgi:hypothetical protein